MNKLGIIHRIIVSAKKNDQKTTKPFLKQFVLQLLQYLQTFSDLFFNPLSVSTLPLTSKIVWR